MRIYVRAEGGKRKFTLMFPTYLIFSSASAHLAAWSAKRSINEDASSKKKPPLFSFSIKSNDENGFSVDNGRKENMSDAEAKAMAKALPALCREIRRYRRRHGRFTLLEAKSNSGEEVKITI